MLAKVRSGSLLLKSALLITVVAVVLVIGWWYSGSPGVASAKIEGFDYKLLGKSYFLNDLGLADINNDGLIDVFTSNHSNSGAVLINQGEAGLMFGLEESAGLHQDRQFPGLAPNRQRPEYEAVGLYMYFMDGALVCENTADTSTYFSGSIRVPWEIQVEQAGDVQVSSEQSQLDTGAPLNLVRFKIHGGSRLIIVPEPVPTLAFPIQIALAHDTPLGKVFVGLDRVSPDTPRFELTLRDRHGMAWADFDQNGINDVFIGRGGIRGKMQQVWPQANDELLVAEGDSFRDRASELGIQKNNCPSRQVAWVDYDGDNRLDLYVVCGRTRGENTHFPNQLYRQLEDGTFSNVARQVGLDISELGTFVWLDVDTDGDPDMVWSDARAYHLYKNEQGYFKAEEIGTAVGIDKHAARLTVSDFDMDGDLDLFAVSRQRNVLLENTGVFFKMVDVETVGLPGQAITANWVDYDNDGLPDLHAVPGGLYRQHQKGQFVATGLLDFGSLKALADARASWVDIDKDGSMDLVLGTRFRPRLKRLQNILNQGAYQAPLWNLHLFRNTLAKGHWLQLDLHSSPGRVALGAHVEFDIGDRVYAAQVGQAEGSHYSQGHRRTYFGLGEYVGEGQLRVRWPDGTMQTVNNVRVDQVVTIQ